jgi:phosphoribosyl 1,2-cyclic phosphodiesterase
MSEALPNSIDLPATPRGLALCVLGSGSGGNVSVIRTSAGVMLIDLGLGPRVTGRRLADIPDNALHIADVRAVCLTHLDHDHFNLNWLATLRKHDIPVYCDASRVGEVRHRAAARGESIDVRGFTRDPFEPLAGVNVSAIDFAHDQTGSHGFVVACGPVRLGYATDLGRVPDCLTDHFCDLDLLAIESNYDRQMQLDSERPWFLKQRIMGGQGHLSNDQAFEFVKQLFNSCERAGRRLPRHVVLLHRSRDCNCPSLLRTFFSRDRRIAARLTLSEQHELTGWLRTDSPVVGEQMMLSWG